MGYGVAARAEARVASGAALLDQDKPGWVDEIDLKSLDLRSGRYCVLGQLYGSYSLGMRILPRTDTVGVNYGFIGDYSVTEHELSLAWASLILNRREQQVVQQDENGTEASPAGDGAAGLQARRWLAGRNRRRPAGHPERRFVRARTALRRVRDRKSVV